MEGREYHHSEATRQEHAPLPDFAIPDISPIPPGEYRKATIVETELRVGDSRLPCKVTFERYPDEELTKRGISEYQRGQLHVEAFDPETKERLITFKAALKYGMVLDEKRVVRDSQPHLYWHIYTRRIEESARHKGFGTAGLQAFEEAARRAAAATADFDAEWVQFDTFLSSLTRMTIDQGWLDAHGLSAFKKTKGPDFGYMPAPSDADKVASVLRDGTEEIDDVGRGGGVEIRLFKRTGEK